MSAEAWHCSLSWVGCLSEKHEPGQRGTAAHWQDVWGVCLPTAAAAGVSSSVSSNGSNSVQEPCVRPKYDDRLAGCNKLCGALLTANYEHNAWSVGGLPIDGD